MSAFDVYTPLFVQKKRETTRTKKISWHFVDLRFAWHSPFSLQMVCAVFTVVAVAISFVIVSAPQNQMLDFKDIGSSFSHWKILKRHRRARAHTHAHKCKLRNGTRKPKHTQTQTAENVQIWFRNVTFMFLKLREWMKQAFALTLTTANT